MINSRLLGFNCIYMTQGYKWLILVGYLLQQQLVDVGLTLWVAGLSSQPKWNRLPQCQEHHYYLLMETKVGNVGQIDCPPIHIHACIISDLHWSGVDQHLWSQTCLNSQPQMFQLSSCWTKPTWSPELLNQPELQLEQEQKFQYPLRASGHEWIKWAWLWRWILFHMNSGRVVRSTVTASAGEAHRQNEENENAEESDSAHQEQCTTQQGGKLS